MAALTDRLESDDHVIRSVAQGAGAEGERSYWLKAAGLPEQTPHSRYKPNWRKGEREKWTSLEVQGVGVETWEGSLPNHVMRNDKILSEANYIGPLKLRTSTFPVKATLARGRRNLDKSCRACGYVTESQAHVISACPRLKDQRIKRHNQVCGLLARCAKRGGWRYMKEPRLRGQDGKVLKPDLVFVKGDKGVVVDPTIRYEQTRTTLTDGNREKVEKYKQVIDQLKTTLAVSDLTVYGLTLGARGGWASSNDAVFKALGLRATSKVQFITKAILSTLDLMRSHNDYQNLALIGPKHSGAWAGPQGGGPRYVRLRLANLSHESHQKC